MPFQFACPQGHWLLGDEAHVGMQTQCPMCGLVFVIPHPAQQPGMAYPGQPQYAPQFPGYVQAPQQYAPGPEQHYGAGPAQQYVADPAAQQIPDAAGQYAAESFPNFGQQPAAEPDPQTFAAATEPAAPAPPPPPTHLADELSGAGDETGIDAPLGLLHIPCPNGHELETPYDLLGEQVLCPHCGAQFLLREQDSVEHRRKLEALEERRGQFWFNMAIAMAVIVGVGLLTMLVILMRN